MDNPADIVYIVYHLSRGDEGRRKAMTRIWSAYGKGIHYYISRTLPGRLDFHDDCFQETMLRIFASLDRYRVTSPLSPWLYRIAHNCCHDMARGRREEPVDEMDALLPGDGPYHEEDLVRNELMREIDMSLGKLDADDARIAYLRFFHGMKFKEIAALMGMNENTVKTRMTSIKKKLRSDLEGWL